MKLHVGSPATFLLLLFVLGAEGLIGAAATIPRTVPNAFMMGLLVGAYLLLAGFVAFRHMEPLFRRAVR